MKPCLTINRRPFYSRLLAWGCALWVGAGVTFAEGNLPVAATSNEVSEAISHVGVWIWDQHAFDKQTCRFWKSFEVPSGTTVSRAVLRLTVDNGYRLFLDGREIGRGSDWKTLTEYDLKWLLNPGTHVIAVEAFNDRLEGGLICGLQIELVDQRVVKIVSDSTWKVVPLDEKNWTEQKNPSPAWHSTIVVGGLQKPPWINWPFAVVAEPPLQPIVLHFWQRPWFQVALILLSGMMLLLCLWLLAQLVAQSKSQRLLQLQRARIARDIHDDLGARLTQLVLLGELAQSELPPQSVIRTQIDRICENARDLSRAMDEVVWAISSRRDTLQDFAAYVCKYALVFLRDTGIRCRLDVEPDLPPMAFDLAIRRNLLLAVKEAISNAAKHSGANELMLRIHRQGEGVRVLVEDDGNGFDIAQADATRNGLMNMAQRMAEVGGKFSVKTAPGQGCEIEFSLPLIHARQRLHWLRWLLPEPGEPSELEQPSFAPAQENETNTRER